MRRREQTTLKHLPTTANEVISMRWSYRFLSYIMSHPSYHIRLESPRKICFIDLLEKLWVFLVRSQYLGFSWADGLVPGRAQPDCLNWEIRPEPIGFGYWASVWAYIGSMWAPGGQISFKVAEIRFGQGKLML